MQKDDAAFLEWISSSDSMFDLVYCEDVELPKNVKVIGPEEIEADLKTAFPVRIGAIPTEKTQRLLQRAASRIAVRLARTRGSDLGVSAGGLTHAWFHAVFSELTSLVPIRHLARLYAKDADKRAIAVRIGPQPIIALNAWNTNYAEPLYLACELRRKSKPVFLVLAKDIDRKSLTFQLSERWLPKGYPRYFHDAKFQAVMCKNAVRRSEHVFQQSTVNKRRKPGALSRLIGSDFRGKSYRLELGLEDGPPIPGFRTYSATRNAAMLDKAFLDLLGPLTARVAKWYHSELKDKSVKVAHVADHASLEGGLLAAEVAVNGGETHVWPHSANVVHMDAHNPDSLSQVTVAVQSTGSVWAKKFGREKVIVDAQTILPDVPLVAPFDDGQPLHVVLFAGSHFLRRVPLFSYEGHKATWSKTLQALSHADAEILIKHKSTWETRDWISKRAAPSVRLRFSNVHANRLKLPNMVFLSISSTSTAILEGIARGIPGIVVRDVPVDETPHYDPESVPCVTSDQIAELISGLNSKLAWTDLQTKQMTWFRQETSPWL